MAEGGQAPCTDDDEFSDATDDKDMKVSTGTFEERHRLNKEIEDLKREELELQEMNALRQRLADQKKSVQNEKGVFVKEWRENLERLIIDKYGDQSNISDKPRPVAHILVLGECGHGKSAMINTIVKTLLGNYYNVADFGLGNSQTKTVYLHTLKHFGILEYMRKGSKVEYKEKEKFLKLLPHITDFVGLANENQASYEEILELLILGYIKPGTTIEAIIKAQKQAGVGKLNTVREFNTAKTLWRVTHILFVQSCQTFASCDLATCLGDVIRKTKKQSNFLTYTGNVHVLMTKYDTIHKGVLAEDYSDEKNPKCSEDDEKRLTEKERKLAKVFNLVGNTKVSFTRWVSYCDDVGYDSVKLDSLVLQFLFNLLKHPIPDDYEETVDSDEESSNSKSWCVVS